VEIKLEGLPEHFEPIRHLGEGGMGVVWSVCDRRVDRIGALKVIRPQSGVSAVTLTRFQREIRNFAQLIHPYIVQVYDVGLMATGEPYIFMEQVTGEPVSSAILREHSFDEIMRFIDKILEALDEAHANRIIHRDLKPDNILITIDAAGQIVPKLMDFGLAMRADETDVRITSTGMVVGTPIYMAPEQACDEHYQICPATDLYGLGCILYELFCGHPPFEGKSAVMVMMAQAKDTPKPFAPLSEFAATIRLGPIIHRLLEKEPDRRYESAADLRATMRKLALVRDDLSFGVASLKQDDDTVFDVRREEEAPFFSNELAPKTYQTILPEVLHGNYNYSILSLRPPVFIGRSSAKHLMERYIKDVYRCRRTAVTLVTGRPGVGKSRFVESFIQDCYRKGIAHGFVVDGSTSEGLRFAAYKALFNRLLLKTLTPPQQALALERFFRSAEKRDIRIQTLMRFLEDETKQNHSHHDVTFCDIFVQLSRTRPLVLCFDNISPGQMRELCSIVVELTTKPSPSLPILICIINATINGMPTDMELALGNESAIWLRRGISIDALSNSDMRYLIQHGLGVCEKLSHFIENISSGLPQIAVSLARQWQLAGLLVPSSLGYVSPQSPDSLPIPRAVHEAILHQLYLTFADYRSKAWFPVATLAAVCGESFTPRLLSGAIQFIPTTQKLISHNAFISLGLAGGVLKTVDESTLAFENPLMRSALKASVEAYEAQDLHYAVARARRQLPSSFENDRQIAHHLSEAHQFYEAFHAFKVMAWHCLMQGDLEKALEYVDVAKESLKQHFGYIDARTPELDEIWFVETEIYVERNDFEHASQQIQWLDYACQFLPQPEKHAMLHVLKSRIAAMQGDDRLAQTHIGTAMRHIEAIEPPLTRAQLRAKFSALVVTLLYDITFHEALLETTRELNDMLYAGKAFLAIAQRCIVSSDWQKATRILNMAIDTAHKHGDMKTEAEALYSLAQIQNSAPEVRLKTLRDALRCYERISEFGALARGHAEIAALLADAEPNESFVHARWSALFGA